MLNFGMKSLSVIGVGKFRRQSRLSESVLLLRKHHACGLPRDLTNDPSYYERRELSKGRFSTHVAPGHYFDKGRWNSVKLREALKSRPPSPGIWFKVGASP
jgi:hypothetical protein